MSRPKSLSNSGHPGGGARVKSVPAGATPASTTGDLFRWDVALLDTQVTDDQDCGWTWRLEPGDLREMLEFLCHTSQRRWGEIEADLTGGKHQRHKKHHDMDVSVLPRCSQDRFKSHIRAVSDESYGTLFRLRYGAKKRLWGIRERAVFHLVWVDLDHAVYPTDPD